MLSAAKAVAKSQGATVTVFDAANDPKKQFAQLQTARDVRGSTTGSSCSRSSGRSSFPVVKQAITAGIKVVNMDQILGPNAGTARPQVAGLSGNVVFVQTRHREETGRLVVQACKAHNLNPCNVGYLYSVKVSSLDTAIRKGFDARDQGGHPIKVVAEGETFYQHASRPEGGADDAPGPVRHQPHRRCRPGCDRARSRRSAGKKVVLVGYGGGGSA